MPATMSIAAPICNLQFAVRNLQCLLVLPLVLLCSCQGLVKREAVQGDQATTQSPAPTRGAPSLARRVSLPEANHYPVQQAQYIPGNLPPVAFTGPTHHDHIHGTVHDYTPCPHCQGHRQPFAFSDELHGGLSWVPDGIAGPWPADEFICDGGDLMGRDHVRRHAHPVAD